MCPLLLNSSGNYLTLKNEQNGNNFIKFEISTDKIDNEEAKYFCK